MTTEIIRKIKYELYLTIKQGEKETLRSYVTRFTRGMLEVDETDDKVQLTTFKARLKSRDFVASLAKNPPQDDGRSVIEGTEVHERRRSFGSHRWS